MAVTNTLAYYDTETNTAVKSFIMLTPEASVIKITAVISNLHY
jgi:hypothetical protein